MGSVTKNMNNFADWLMESTGPKPKVPGMPAAPPAAPEMQDVAIRNAKLMERRRQLGMAGRGSTWLTGARGDTVVPTVGTKTLLGG